MLHLLGLWVRERQRLYWSSPRKKCYVSFLNLAHSGALTVPKRSVTAKGIASTNDREAETTYSECYVSSIVEQTVIYCKMGITALAFWEMQAMEQFRGFQAEVNKHI